MHIGCAYTISGFELSTISEMPINKASRFSGCVHSGRLLYNPSLPFMWEGHDKGHSAEAQAATEDVDFGLLALYVDNRFAPVNLYGFTRIEDQRNKGFCWFIL